MILIFATSRSNTSGRRKYLIIDTINSRFSTEPRRAYYSREEFTEIGSRDRARMIEDLKNAGFIRADFID